MMKYRIATCTLLISLLTFCCSSHKGIREQDQSLSVTYTGNMGVYISSSKASVLIDGLHEYYGPEYLHTPDAEIRKILEQQGQFGNLNIALFTHYHKDHYSSTLARRFLQISEKNRVAGPPQVTDSLPTLQTINAWNKNAVLFADSSAGLFIYAFNIPHTWPQRHSKVQNVTYLVKSGDVDILHTGDANTDLSAFRNLRISKIDIMIVPVWFLMNEEGMRIIKEIIKPAKVIATHISPREKQPMDKYKLPGIETHFFTEPNQIVNLPG